MKGDKKLVPVLYALCAAVFYALNVPCSKILLAYVPPVFMAGLLYVGAGLGVGVLYLFRFRAEDKDSRLCASDLPYVLGMVALDIAAPIFLMLGVKEGSSAGASLLGNFEIVATTLIALLLFREKVSGRLWVAILLITASSVILSFGDGFALADVRFSAGSLFVLAATVCWGFENNCTRKISAKSTYQIVMIKGLCSGFGSVVIALASGERLTEYARVPLVLLLGFVAYGLSIFTYVRAQKHLGAAKTSAFYAVAPFIGVALSFVLLGERVTVRYLVALFIMLAGTALVVHDTLCPQGEKPRGQAGGAAGMGTEHDRAE